MSERSDIQHVESLLWLLKEIGANGLRLYEHRCTLQGFGSFTTVLGTAHNRVKFDWDGKEFVLSVSTAAVANQNGIENWQFEANIRLPNGEGLFEEISSKATELLAG